MQEKRGTYRPAINSATLPSRIPLSKTPLTRGSPLSSGDSTRSTKRGPRVGCARREAMRETRQMSVPRDRGRGKGRRGRICGVNSLSAFGDFRSVGGGEADG